MDDMAALLNALQHGDSFFPSGAVSFSWGLEAMAADGGLRREEEVRAFILGQLDARWAKFDRPVVAHAHRAAGDLDRLQEIDLLVECCSPVAELRLGSRRMGDAMLTVFARLGSAQAQAYRARQKSSAAPGHLAAMQGLLWAEAGLSEAAALALSAHTCCTGLASAALRLGLLTHISAQRVLAAARAQAAAIADRPLPSLDSLGSSAIEAEIAVMRHAGQDLRLFAN